MFLIRRFCNVPWEIASIFLTSELLSHSLLACGCTAPDKIRDKSSNNCRRNFCRSSCVIISYVIIMVLNLYNGLSILLMLFTSWYQLGIDLFVLLLIQNSMKAKGRSTQLSPT